MGKSRLGWSCLMAAVLVLVGAAAAPAAEFFNSSEPGCDGSDPNVLHCDDFEDGSWIFSYWSGGAPAGVPLNDPSNDGWWPAISTKLDPQGTGWGRCGGLGVAGTNCVATSGVHNGTGQAPCMGSHGFVGNAEVTNFYYRYYVKPLTGFIFGQEKSWSPTWEFQSCSLRFGSSFFGWGDGSQTFRFYAGNEPDGGGGTGVNYFQNQGNAISMTPGRWYAIQYHFIRGTPGVKNGTIEMWVDDCGTNGLGCTGTPTLRMRHTNVMHLEAGETIGVRSVCLENWANAESVGEMYYDQLKVSRVGPIPFSGVTQPTAFNVLATQGTYAVSGAVATLTQLAGPTLIGFVHRALLLIVITALLVLRRRHAHR